MGTGQPSLQSPCPGAVASPAASPALGTCPALAHRHRGEDPAPASPLRVPHRGTDPSSAMSACTRPCPILLTTLTRPDTGEHHPAALGVSQVGSRGRAGPPGQDPPLSPLGPSALSSVPAQGSAPGPGSGHDTAATGTLNKVPREAWGPQPQGTPRGGVRGAVPAGAAAGRAILRAAGALGGTDGPRGG